MDWLTEEQVKTEADKGKLAAMKCSLLHHEQGRDAELMELINAIEDTGTFYMDSSFCACCQQFDETLPGCNECPLHSKAKINKCCGGKFLETKELFSGFVADYSNANFKAFQEAEAQLCKYIEGKIAEEESKGEKSKCDPKLKNGDVYVSGTLVVVVRSHPSKWIGTHKDGSQFEGSEDDLLKHIKNFYFSRNIFDDLKRNSEDLKEFEVDNMKIWFHEGWNTIRLRAFKHRNYRQFTLSEAEEIHQKLGQLIATAKRQQSKSK